MNDLSVAQKQLPKTLSELTKFALVGREKLASVRAEIRAIQKVGLAKEVLEQKREEAQEIAELVTLSEMQIGLMLKKIPKASGGDRRSEDFKNNPVDTFETKQEATREMGFSPKQVSQFQRMSEHEDVVREAIAEAREQDEIITRSAVLKKIDETTHKPHVANNSGDNEWYTPAEYIEAAREVMGSIDLDPASNELANKTVKAQTFYTAEINGLNKEWFGNVWLNPPYSASLVQAFAEKVISSNFQQAVILVNNATDTAWFRKLIEKADAILFTTGRIRFYKMDGEKGAPLQGQAFIYYGDSVEKFLEVFGKFGWGAKL